MYVCLNRDPPATKGGSSCRTVPCVAGGWPEPDLPSVPLLVFAALCVTKLCVSAVLIFLSDAYHAFSPGV